jgi:hypothetical protein
MKRSVAAAVIAVAVAVPLGFAVAQIPPEQQSPDAGGLEDQLVPEDARNAQPVDPADIPTPPHGEESIQIPTQRPPSELVEMCREELQRDPGNEACQLTIKASNGEVLPGVYPQDQAGELLGK